jgi:hypothetical protein
LGYKSKKALNHALIQRLVPTEPEKLKTAEDNTSGTLGFMKDGKGFIHAISECFDEPLLDCLHPEPVNHRD